ncbi:MAG: hypothetical protein JXA91_07685 [Candidatus Thermoplasmatota archaeon]|nr:hypothetical protein [Candidatus Thermoplasmatota archaeon]
MLLLFVSTCYALEPITEFNWEISEDKKAASKWVGMISADKNNLYIQCMVIREQTDKLILDSWESGKTMQVELLYHTDTTISFLIVYPNERGVIRVTGCKVKGLFTFTGYGSIKNALANGNVFIEIKSIDKILLCGKNVVWKF